MLTQLALVPLTRPSPSGRGGIAGRLTTCRPFQRLDGERPIISAALARDAATRYGDSSHWTFPKVSGIGLGNLRYAPLTRWTTKAQVSCHACAVKQQLGGAAFSFFCGWWGFRGADLHPRPNYA